MIMKEVVIVGGSRTAIAAFGGSLQTVPVVELGAIVMKDVLKKTGLRPVLSDEMKAVAPDKLKNQGMIDIEKNGYDWDDSLAPVVIDEVIMGNVLQAAQGQNTARQAMVRAGISKGNPGFYGKQNLWFRIKGDCAWCNANYGRTSGCGFGRRPGKYEPCAHGAAQSALGTSDGIDRNR